MWSLLFCISRTSTPSRFMAARTAFQRRSSSAVEIGVCRRSLSPLPAMICLPDCGNRFINALRMQDKLIGRRPRNIFRGNRRISNRQLAFLYNCYLGRPPQSFAEYMEALLVKVFATALALSLVMTRPDAVKTQFGPATDQAEVLAVLGAGCDARRKSFDIDNIDLDGLIDTVMIDKQAAAGEIAGFKGIKFNDLHLAYKQLCKHEKIDREVIDVGQVIEFYNRAAADLPDHNRLKGLKLPGMTTVLDGTGAKFAELFEPDSRRQWVPLAEIPEFVQKAFIAAEDKRFFEHKGVDVRSVTRAFMATVGGDKRQGGSTITQQVAKNLLVGDSVTFERKIREVIVASRIEKEITKQEILEIYINSIYLGRSSWGIDLAARAYFGKPVKDLSLAEGAFIAGLTKGPAYFNPDRYRERAHERLAYVLTRMKEDGSITAPELSDAEAAKLNFV